MLADTGAICTSQMSREGTSGEAHMGGTSDLKGPDLTLGVPADSVVEGRPFLGHAHGEAAMMVRSGGRLFATAATCTHYGGPLAEGLVVGKTVHCPWHHACFDLATGHAAGPALTPISCFDVIEEEGLVRVAQKREAAKPQPPRLAPASVVIVGGGPAGAACAENLRRLGYEGPLSLIADEPPGPVDRPNLSKDYLAGNAPEEWIPLRDEAFYRKKKIDFSVGDGVARIDTAAHTVTRISGKTLTYGALLLATGAAPRRLAIPGADAENVHVLRTLADSHALIARANDGARAVVIGSSFIGLEVAASLRARQVAVDVVSVDDVPLGRVVGDTIGRFVQKLHEDHGVRFHLGRPPKAISGRGVELEDGTLAADFVVLGVGVTPRTALAEAAGLTGERGIVVDDHFRTSADGVYAAGDVASFPDFRTGTRVRIEHWQVAERHGQAVARAMLGLGEPYRDVPFFWSAHYDVTLNYVGHAEKWDRILERGSLADRKYVAAFEHRGQVLAVVTLGEDLLSLEIEAAMNAGDEAKVKALALG
jgi:NADPH-dependent 2,4-dienoyl-CoA reductase/sulfur reductase-like enzyme/nitrite reductase/ring-hydroxylating ferredoxin subunit